MKSVPQFKFHQTKYGEELLIDVVTLDEISRYIRTDPVHTLSYFDITFITGNPVDFAIDDECCTLYPGDVVFSRPNEVRAWNKDRLPQGYALLFEEEFLLSFFNDPCFVRNLSFFNRARNCAKIHIAPLYPRIERLLEDIRTEINDERSNDKHILRALLYEILMLLNREYLKNDLSVPEKSRNRYVDDFVNLVERDFTVCRETRYYAGKLCIAPNYLNDIVRKNMGIGPKCYIQRKIVREAKRLLSYTTLSVKEIAEKLNFEDPSYFIRLFRRQTALTPLQYRRSVIR